ncbi:DUF5667 domain-containing protein [Patescibacteria group bacterium]
MKKKELIKKLNSLQHKIKPDQDWQLANREILLSQIKAQTRLELATKKNKLWTPVFSNQMLRVSVRSFASICAVFLIVFGTWIATVSATKNSLPGDLLYGLKLTTERVQVNLTLDDEKRTNLELEFTDRRMDEVNKVIAEEKTDKSKENKENIDVALVKFTESLDNVKSGLAKLEANDATAAVKLANILDEKTEEYEDVLRDHQDNDPKLVMETEEAITASQSTADKALSVIIKEYESGESELSLEELIAKMDKRINKLEANTLLAQTDIESIITNKELAVLTEASQEEGESAGDEDGEVLEDEEQVEEETDEPVEEQADDSTEDVNEQEEGEESAETTEAEEEQAQPAEQENNQESGSEEEPNTEEVVEEDVVEEVVEELPTIEEIQEKPAAILALLTEAKDLLEQNEISQSFDKIKQAKEILIILNKVINVNIEFLPQEEEVEEVVEQEETVDENTEAEADASNEVDVEANNQEQDQPSA